MESDTPQRFLIDTDVLIDFLRGNPKAVQFLHSVKNRKYVSCITVAELYAGVKESKEQTILDKFIHLFDVLSVNAEIAQQGGLFRRDYSSSGTGLADAIIAATADHWECTLVTLNRRHFPMLRQILVPYQK